MSYAYNPITSVLDITGGVVDFTKDTIHVLKAGDTMSGGLAFNAGGIALNDSNGNEALKITTTTSAVNQFDLTNAATLGSPAFSVTGDDTNISMLIKAKGTGGVFAGYGNTAFPFQIVSASTSSLAKYLVSSGTLKGSFGYYATTGSFVVLDSVSTNVISSFKQVTTGVNYLEMTNAVTTANPILSAVGSDTNIGLTLTPKGVGKILFNGAQKVIRTTVADQAYTVLDSDYIVAYTSISATRIVTLVASATAGAGAVLIVKDESGSVTQAIKITVDGNGAETIDGAASQDITAAYGVLRLYCNGTNWFTF